jgi:hypothetical protein
VVINERGRKKSISKLEAAWKQLAHKAASGDLGAIKLMASFTLNEDLQSSQDFRERPFAAMDREVLEGALERLGFSGRKDQ